MECAGCTAPTSSHSRRRAPRSCTPPRRPPSPHASRRTTRTCGPRCLTRSPTREPDDVGRILGALYPFLISHGDLAEVRAWGEAALEARDRLSEAGRAEALVGTSEIARFGGDLDRARELKEELATVQVELQRPNWRAATLADLCELALDQGNFAAARTYAEQSAAAGAGARAELCFAELALRTGDVASAESHSLAALGGLAEGAFNHATTLELLGEAARRAGDVERARGRFADALRAFAALNDGGGIADSLDGLGRVAATAGDATRAGRLLGSRGTPARDARAQADPRRPPAAGGSGDGTGRGACHGSRGRARLRAGDRRVRAGARA